MKLALPSLSASAFEVITKDEWLKQRLAEIEVSTIQMAANEAAKARNWDKVDVLLKKAKKKAGKMNSYKVLSRRN